MINFCHIVPTKLLSEFTPYNGAHLLLAHLVESDREYQSFYNSLYDGKERIMDNSAFEMYKAGLPMYDSTKLVTLAKTCRADYVVMSDYPKEDGLKTIKAAKELAFRIKDAGMKTFFCPQSEKGDIDDLMLSIEWALDSNIVDRIGISILNCPIALGIEETKHGEEHTRKDWFKLQRFMSRWAIFREMEKRHLLSDWEKAHKKFHCLGMTDGPREIELLAPYKEFIATWDSSAAVWAGLHFIDFDKSPTGLIEGKFEKEVDFSWDEEYDSDHVSSIRHNIQYINRLCKS